MNFLTKSVLGAISMASVFAMLQGCGGDTEQGACCQDKKPVAKAKEETKSSTIKPVVKGKIEEIDKVVEVPEVQGERIVYIDRNVTVIKYHDRNVTVIKFHDRNVTVDRIKVRPDARIDGFQDGDILTGNTLVLDGMKSSDSDGNVTKYKWTLDDKVLANVTNNTIDLPADAGTYKLCLEVTDNDSLVSPMTCKTFVIPAKNLDPTAAISIPKLNDQNGTKNKIKTICPFEVNADNSVATDSTIVSYVWTIDNNQTLTGKKQTLSFSTLGNHEVCLEVTDSNGLKNRNCNTITVNKHEAPTPNITITDVDGMVITKDSLFKRLGKYNLSCAGSKDDCGNEEPMTCEWNAYSYRLGKDGEEIPYIGDCFNTAQHDAHGPRISKDSWLRLCSSDASRYTHVHVDLKVTDRFGKTQTKKVFFTVAP